MHVFHKFPPLRIIDNDEPIFIEQIYVNGQF